MNGPRRQFASVVIGVVLGCLALVLTVVLPPMFAGSPDAQTTIDPSPPAQDLALARTPSGAGASASPASPTASSTARPGGMVAGSTGRTQSSPTGRVGAAGTRSGSGGGTGSGGTGSGGTAPSRTTTSARPSPAASAPVPAGAGSPITGTPRPGTATYYAPAAPGGACMTLTIPASRYTVAVGPAEFAGSSACGSYVQITGARGTILAKVDNLCPECAAGHLDLSTEAFAAIDDPVKGQVPITYHAVRDPAVSGGLVFEVKDGSSQYWLGLHVDNTGNALALVEVAGGAGPLRPMTRSTTGFWVLTNPGAGPYRVRVTDIYGHAVVATNIALDVGALQPTSVTLY